MRNPRLRKMSSSVIHLVNSNQLFSFSSMDKTLQIDLVKLRFKTKSIWLQNPHFLRYIILSPGNIELQHVFLTLTSYSDNSSVSYMSEWVNMCVCVCLCVCAHARVCVRERALAWEQMSLHLWSKRGLELTLQGSKIQSLIWETCPV